MPIKVSVDIISDDGSSEKKIFNISSKILMVSTYVKSLVDEYPGEIIPLIGSIDDLAFKIFNDWLSNVYHETYVPEYYLRPAVLKNLQSSISSINSLNILLELMKFGINNQINDLAQEVGKITSKLGPKITFKNGRAYVKSPCYSERVISITEAMILTKFMITPRNTKSFPTEILKMFRYNPTFEPAFDNLFNVETNFLETIREYYPSKHKCIIYSGSVSLAEKSYVNRIVFKHLSGTDIGRKLKMLAIIGIVNEHPEYFTKYLEYTYPRLYNISKEKNSQFINADARVCVDLAHLLLNLITTDHLSEKQIYDAYETTFDKSSYCVPDSVYKIYPCCFAGSSNLKSINFSKSVEVLGFNSFQNCVSLSELTLPNSIYKIEKECFADCSSLSAINNFDDCNYLPPNIRILHTRIFKGCKLYNMNLNNVFSINNGVFENCTHLTSLTLSGCIEVIRSETFKNCYNLVSLKFSGQTDDVNRLPPSCFEIESNAFENCTSLTNLDISGVSVFNPNCFDNCGFFELSFPTNFVKISNVGLQSMRNLNRVNIPKKGLDIMKGLDSSILFKCYEPLTHDEIENALRNTWAGLCNEKTFIKNPLMLPFSMIPAGTENLYDGCFKKCEMLHSIYMPQSITHLGNNICEGCKLLTTITFSSSIEKIPQQMFKDCSALKNLDIPTTITSIGVEAFKNCKQLSSVDVRNIKFFSKGCFEDCESLDGLELTNIKSIPVRFVRGCKSLSSIRLPKQIMFIGDGAFEGCEKLKLVDLSCSACKKIGKYAFENCSSLTRIILPNIREVSERCFMNCSSLKYVDWNLSEHILPPTVVTLCSSAFEGCKRLVKLNLNKTQEIKDSCFYDCASLTELKNISSKMKIGKFVFGGCISLKRDF